MDKLLVFKIEAVMPVDDGDFGRLSEAIDLLREAGVANIVDVEVITGSVETYEPTAEQR